MIHFLSKCNIHGVTFAAIEALPMCALDAQVVTQPMPLTPSYEPLFGGSASSRRSTRLLRTTYLRLFEPLSQRRVQRFYISGQVWNKSFQDHISFTMMCGMHSLSPFNLVMLVAAAVLFVNDPLVDARAL
jgi:hypothetical protein